MRRIVLVLTLSACGFDGATAGDEAPADSIADGTDLGDGTTDEVPVSCGDLACDANASCDAAGPRCVCNPGFAGDGQTCTDVDECATANGGCDALCVNEAGGASCAAPATCAELRTLLGTTVTDGEYRLWLDGDPQQPWTAYCHDMSGSPREFLTVQATYSLYASTAVGAGVRTTYDRVRVLLGPPRIAITDRTFARLNGSLTHDGTEVTSMPVGVAMDCLGQTSAAGDARLDLTGTSFAISQQFARGGNTQAGEALLAANDKQLRVSGGGFCGWNGPTGVPYNPFNDNAAASTIGLRYQP